MAIYQVYHNAKEEIGSTCSHNHSELASNALPRMQGLLQKHFTHMRGALESTDMLGLWYSRCANAAVFLSTLQNTSVESQMGWHLGAVWEKERVLEKIRRHVLVASMHMRDAVTSKLQLQVKNQALQPSEGPSVSPFLGLQLASNFDPGQHTLKNHHSAQQHDQIRLHKSTDNYALPPN